MTKKVENLTEYRNKKKPPTVQDASRRAARRFRDKVPKGLSQVNPE